MSPPPKWTPPGIQGPQGAPAAGEGTANVIEAAAGLGGALGYWLPLGINRAKAASKRLVKTVS